MTDAAALDPALRAVLRLGGACLLLGSAAAKLRDRPGFARAVRGYALLPDGWAGPVAAGLVALELLLGSALLVPAPGPTSALAAAALLSLYSGAVAVNLARGRRDIDCGCGGARGRPLGGALLARNAVLIALLALAALPPSGRALSWVDGITVVAGVCVLAALYATQEVLAALPAPPREEGAR